MPLPREPEAKRRPKFRGRGAKFARFGRLRELQLTALPGRCDAPRQTVIGRDGGMRIDPSRRFDTSSLTFRPQRPPVSPLHAGGADRFGHGPVRPPLPLCKRAGTSPVRPSASTIRPTPISPLPTVRLSRSGATIRLDQNDPRRRTRSGRRSERKGTPLPPRPLGIHRLHDERGRQRCLRNPLLPLRPASP